MLQEPGEYSVGIRFNDQHIPDSPYRVFILPRSDHADKVTKMITKDLTTACMGISAASGP